MPQAEPQTQVSGHPAVAVPSLSVHRMRVLLSLAAMYFIWGSAFFAIKVAVQDFPPLLMSGGRYALAGALLYAFLRIRGVPRPDGRQWLASLKVSLLLLVLSNGLLVMAEQWVDSSVAALAVATSPLWTALFAGIWERWPSRPEWTGLVLGFAGMVLLNGHSDLQAHPLAAAALIGSAVSWAAGSILGRHAELPSGMMASAAQMLTGGSVLALVGLGRGEWVSGLPGSQAGLALIYLALFSSLIGFSAFTYLIHHTRPALALSYAYVNPAVAVVVGAMLGGEQINRSELVAMVLTVAGVFFLMQGRGRDRPHVGHAHSARP